MPDIREVLNALDDHDKKLWSQHRTEMRKSFMTAHNSVLGLQAWNAEDDMMLDYIDIKLALLFDRAGRMESLTSAAKQEDVKEIEAKVAEAEDAMKNRTNHKFSPATESMKAPIANGGWGQPT